MYLRQPWKQVAADFHERVRAASWESLSGRLLRLHEPHVIDDQPDCHGCDHQQGDDPVWPCRTYTIIALTVLDTQDVEAELVALSRRP